MARTQLTFITGVGVRHDQHRVRMWGNRQGCELTRVASCETPDAKERAVEVFLDMSG